MPITSYVMRGLTLGYKDKEKKEAAQDAIEMRIHIDLKSANETKVQEALQEIFGDCFFWKFYKATGEIDDQTIQEVDGAYTGRDRDQRLKTICVFFEDYAEQYPQGKGSFSAAKIKDRILRSWKALQDLGVTFSYQYPTGDVPLEVISAGEVSLTPFSYTTNKPWQSRHGILFESNPNPNNYTNPLSEIVITPKDLKKYQISHKPAQVLEKTHKEMLKHSNEAQKQINQELQEAVASLANEKSIFELCTGFFDTFPDFYEDYYNKKQQILKQYGIDSAALKMSGKTAEQKEEEEEALINTREAALAKLDKQFDDLSFLKRFPLLPDEKEQNLKKASFLTEIEKFKKEASAPAKVKQYLIDNRTALEGAIKKEIADINVDYAVVSNPSSPCYQPAYRRGIFSPEQQNNIAVLINKNPLLASTLYRRQVHVCQEVELRKKILIKSINNEIDQEIKRLSKSARNPFFFFHAGWITEKKGEALENLKKALSAPKNAEKSIDTIIEDWLQDKSFKTLFERKKVSTHTIISHHRNCLFDEKRTKLTTTEEFIESIKNRYCQPQQPSGQPAPSPSRLSVGNK